MQDMRQASAIGRGPHSAPTQRGARLPEVARAVLVVAVLVGCGRGEPLRPARPHAPAGQVRVTLDRVTLRASVYADLHAHLLSAVAGREPPLPGLSAAVATYGRDAEAARASRALLPALGACGDRPCALSRFGPSRVGDAFASVAPIGERAWEERYAAVSAAISASRAAAAAMRWDALVSVLSRQLQIAWPDDASVDLVASPLDAADGEVLAPALSARGPCFVVSRRERDVERHAKTTACVLAHATTRLAGESALYRAMAARAGEAKARRAWDRLAPFAVAALLLARAGPHLSVPLRAVEATDRDAAEWLRREWGAHVARESDETFAERAASALGG